MNFLVLRFQRQNYDKMSNMPSINSEYFSTISRFRENCLHIALKTCVFGKNSPIFLLRNMSMASLCQLGRLPTERARFAKHCIVEGGCRKCMRAACRWFRIAKEKGMHEPRALLLIGIGGPVVRNVIILIWVLTVRMLWKWIYLRASFTASLGTISSLKT